MVGKTCLRVRIGNGVGYEAFCVIAGKDNRGAAEKILCCCCCTPHDGTAPNRGTFARVHLRGYGGMNSIYSDEQSLFSAMDFFLSFKFCGNVIAMGFIVD